MAAEPNAHRMPQDGPTCPTAAPPAPERIFAPWVRATCPNLRDGWRCVAEHARRREACRLMLDPPKRCPWAERGPALSAAEPVFRAYLLVAGGPWWSRRRAGAMGAPVSVAVAPTPGRVGRRCRECGTAIPFPRRLCDSCRTAARRRTWREAAKRYREGA
jgi:hypothetical protein